MESSIVSCSSSPNLWVPYMVEGTSPTWLKEGSRWGGYPTLSRGSSVITGALVQWHRGIRVSSRRWDHGSRRQEWCEGRVMNLEIHAGSRLWKRQENGFSSQSLHKEWADTLRLVLTFTCIQKYKLIKLHSVKPLIALGNQCIPFYASV